MNKFNRLLKLMSDAAYFVLITVEFIFGLWVCFIPMGLATYFFLKAWNLTDPVLSNFERFRDTVNSIFWESLLVLALMIIIRKIVYWAIEYSKKIESE